MKNLIILVLVFFAINSNAQNVEEYITMGEKYKNQIFYSLENGVVATVENKGWDIAFSCSGRGAAGSAILINELSTTLWNGTQDTSQWNSIDTTDLNNWERLLNSDTTWTNGAFNAHRGATGNFDMGWGVLNPQNNFWTLGDSIYVAKVGPNFKKIWILSLKQGVWEFKYADLDGNNEKTISFDKKDYPNRNFLYFSFQTGEFIDREPDNTTWDLTFVKHQDEVIPGLIIPVTSVFSNVKVWSAKSNLGSYDDAIAATQPLTAFTQKIDNIGREWKKFDSSIPGWSVFDNNAYFVYNSDSTQLYRIVFTGFAGQDSGEVLFEKELLQTVDVTDVDHFNHLKIMPSVAKSSTVVFLNAQQQASIEMKMYNMAGEQVYENQVEILEGINLLPIDLSHLPQGIYLVKVGNSQWSSTLKLIKI